MAHVDTYFVLCALIFIYMHVCILILHVRSTCHVVWVASEQQRLACIFLMIAPRIIKLLYCCYHLVCICLFAYNYYFLILYVVCGCTMGVAPKPWLWGFIIYPTVQYFAQMTYSFCHLLYLIIFTCLAQWFQSTPTDRRPTLTDRQNFQN